MKARYWPSLALQSCREAVWVRFISSPRSRRARDEHTVSGRAERGGAARTRGAVERRQAPGAQTQKSSNPSGGRRGRQRRDDREHRAGRRIDGLSNQATLRRRQSGTRAERGAATRDGAQTVRQGNGVAGGDRLLQPAERA